MPNNVRSATSLIVIFCATLWACSTIANASGVVQVDGNGRRSLSTSPDIDSTWRHTKYGWQDSASWPAGDSFAPTKTVELLHPFAWAGTVLIGAIAAMIWASSEWEIARLFKSDDQPPTQTNG